MAGILTATDKGGFTMKSGHILRLSAATCLVFAAASPAGAAEKANFVEHATSDTVIDTGAAGDSAGDLLTFANDVFDEANSAKVGTDNGFCIRTVVAKAWECYFTISLAEGQVTVEGPFLDGADSTLAVTGGTGEYKSSRGDMLLHQRNKEGSEFDFKLDLTD